MFVILEALCDAVPVKLLFLSKEDALAFMAFAIAGRGGNGYSSYWVDESPYEISVIPKGATASLSGDFIKSMLRKIEARNPDVEIEWAMGSKTKEGVRFLTFKFEHDKPVNTVDLS